MIEEGKISFSKTSRKSVKYPILNEREFYEIYLKIDNLTKEKDKRLTEDSKAFELILWFLTKEPTETVIINSRKKDKNIDIISQKLGIKPNHRYQLLFLLREKGYLTVDEDGFVDVNDELAALKKQVQYTLDNFDAMPFEYLFKATIVRDDEENDGNIPRSI